MATIIKKIDELGMDFLANFISASIHGQCYHFAIAMHRGLDWPIVGLIDGANIIHAGVKSPEGKIWDGRGEVSEKEFIKPFTEKTDCVIRNITEEDLLNAGKKAVFNIDHVVKVIQEKAQIIWPELPWKQGGLRDRIITFADELEALSRKHRLWICGTFPTILPVIFEGYDDEAGYEINPTIDGNAYTINRVIV